ncbi:Glycosyltransferase family 1 protein [Vibrio chagasii]|nr:Glycosyltransferase family 1 protein [Vibrio chagasii]CAH7484435.1 Glycosyltransferase family 1 protein [Vibrio chagasii]
MNKAIVLSANTSWYLYNFRSSTIKALKSIGFDVFCVSPKDDYSSLLESELACNWIELKMEPNRTSFLKDLNLLIAMFRIYSKIKPVALFNFTIKNNIYGTIAGRILGIRVINNISGLGTVFIQKSFTTTLVKILYRLTQPFAYKVFCQNPDDYQYLVRQRLIKASKLSLLPGSGVDVIRFNPSTRIIGNDNFTFLYVGRMLIDKGVVELIEASSKLALKHKNKFRLILCGAYDPNNPRSVPEQFMSNLDEIPFIDWIGTTNEIENVYRLADCVVLPSYREGLPRTLLESGAMGLPSISTDVPGCRHVIIDSYNGYICKPKSSQSLLTSMQKMLTLEREGYDELSKNSRKHVEKYFDEKIVVNFALEAVDDL